MAIWGISWEKDIAWSHKVLPKFSLLGNTSTSLERNTSPLSTRYKHGSLHCVAISSALKYFFNVSQGPTRWMIIKKIDFLCDNLSVDLGLCYVLT